MTAQALELIDTHCHLNYDFAPKSEQDIITEAHAAGVSTLITICTDIESIPKVQEISERHPTVFHSVGVHPHEAITWKDGDSEILKKAASHPKCLAIGEIGLDYHYDHSPQDTQRKILEFQLNIAAQVSLPVVIHSRDAEEDLLKALTTYARALPTEAPRGVIHCFSGSQEFGLACVALGFYLSYSGIITFKTAESLREGLKQIPMDRILIETDSPYLAPIPYRGKKCEPAMVRLTAQKIAEIKSLTLEEVGRQTSRNARTLFKFARV